MAEEGSVYELEGLEKHLQSLLSRYSSDDLRADSKPFCSDFCKLVEEYASRWQVPLPQLRILELALCYFARASTSFASNCDHVLHTLSSLALSVFELLLFFDQNDFHQEPLQNFTVTFQECHLVLARHQNVHLLQVERLVQGGGPWASSVLQAILSESSLPQSEVDGCISSELPVFFELRVRYLLSCEQRAGEAMALAKCCARHPTAGQHLFFLQVYLTWLLKTSQHDSLHKEVADLNGKDAIHIICSLECEEEDELLLSLSRAFLSQQLRRGDMHYLCDLVFVWSKLHSRLNTSKQALLEESHQLMLSATNVNSIFPFIRAIMQELGEDGTQFCVELCANALGSCLPCDVITKSLIYKTIAGLLPNDLEVCRACALLVFFLERTVEAYKMVYLLYMHPDQEYHVECSPIRNQVRFETLQVLKKDLYFDPEFWNLIALRTNCLKLMNEKVVSAALEEIMEDKWILNYYTKEPALRSSRSACQKGKKGALQAAAQKRQHKEDTDAASKRLKMGPGKTRLNVDNIVKKKGNKGPQPLKDASSKPLRRSFWQLGRLQDNAAVGCGELRRTTRLSEKNPPKRRIRKPRWLLEDSGTLEENNVPSKVKKHGLKHQKHHQSSVIKRTETGQVKNDAKHKPSVNSHLMASENNSKRQKELSLDSVKPATPPQVILELSLPDNELMGTFIEDTCNRQRGFPQVLLYKPTVKHPAAPQPAKTVHRKEVILRARDTAMFVQQLHCYARRQKGKGNGSNIQGSVSTITRSSVQGSPPKEKPAAEMKVEVTESPVSEKDLETQTTRAAPRKTSSSRELSEKSAVDLKVTSASQTSAATEATEAQRLERKLCEESAVEMKVTIASQTPTAAKGSQSPGQDKVSKCQTVKEAPKTTTSVVTDEIPAASNTTNISNTGAVDPPPSQSRSVVLRARKQELKSLPSQAETGKNPAVQAKADTPGVSTTVSNGIDDSHKLSKGDVRCKNDTNPRGTKVAPSKTEATYAPTDQNSLNDISALTLVTEMVTELPPEALARDLENHKQPAPDDSVSKESTAGSKPKVPRRLRTTSNCSVPDDGASPVADVQGLKEGTRDIGSETPENGEPMEPQPESEESKLEYCCTFCNKVFKGSRVVAHAMFHYRKDECMFCGTTFKDDLLAMMHLSDHIEKLKRSKDTAGNNVQESWTSETKDISTPKTSAKAKTTNVSSQRRSSGRQRKSVVSPISISLPDSTSPGSRKLRSNDKPVHPSLQGMKQNMSKHLNSKTPVHKVNGHTGKKKELDRLKKDILKQELLQERTSHGAESSRLQENKDTEMDSAPSVQRDGCSTENKRTESLQVLKTVTKQEGKAVEEKNVQPQEKVSCPVDGCTWFTDLSKNRVALLYHALEDHYGEVKPLELAFRVGNSRCTVCMRVLWSFEHFQHHVERHRLSPRHPCPHQDCTARFKTGMEMRRHARRHSPLQAACCLPGCSQIFICLWALNLHEREHYASKPDKNTNEQTGDKHNNTPTAKKLDHKPKDATATTTVNKTVSMKVARKLRGQDRPNSSTGKHVKAPPPTSVRSSLLKQQKESSETKDSHVLKNLSNKDTSAQPAGPNLRLRQTLRKGKVTSTTLASVKSHKVISSSLLKHNIRVRHKLRKQIKVNTKALKRRGRPPKSKKAVHDENTTAGQNKTAVQKDQKTPDQLTSPPKAAEASNVSNKLEGKSQVQDVATDIQTSINESKSKKSMDKQIKKNHVKQKGISDNASKSVMTTNSLNQSVATTSGDKTQKSSADKMKKLLKAKKRSAPKENGSHTVSSDSSKSKKHKVTNSKANTEIVKKKCPVEEPESASMKPAKSKSVPQDEAKAVESSANEEGKAKTEKVDLTQNSSGNVPANSVNEITAPPTTSGEKTQKVTADKKSKKSQIANKDRKKEKNTLTPSTYSGKTNKKHKDDDKKRDKKLIKDKQQCKDSSKTSALKKTAKPKSANQQVGAKGAVLKSSADVEKARSLNETTSSPTVSEEKVTKNSDLSKANMKLEDIHKEGDTMTVENKCEETPAKSETVQSLIDVKAEPVTPGYSLIMNGQAASEDIKSNVSNDAFTKYNKRPFMRPPPTAYLDEKYITMPKRRKEMSFLHSSQRNPRPEQAKGAVQRQRCANCFATFNNAEDLQGHLQLQKCSNLFGFDSDDEGNS